MNILLFVLLTLVAYLAIDFAVYWIGTNESVSFNDILVHNFKMLPIYLIANIGISYGFILGNGELKPIMLFSISIAVWIISLLLVSVILYKTQINLTVLVGMLIITVGAIIVNKGIS